MPRTSFLITYLCTMAKLGSAKNTKNKSKHTKLMTRKTNKLRAEKELRIARLRDVLNRSRKSTDVEEAKQ